MAADDGVKTKTTGTDEHGNGELVDVPFVNHRISLQYVRNKLIATCLRLPIQFFLTVAYYTLFGSLRLRSLYGARRRRLNVPSRQHGRSIKADLYWPVGVNPEKDRLPVFINWHGSGFVLKCFTSDAEMCAYLANKTKCYVIDADYRKAPENPFPACIQDGEDMCAYVFARPQQFDPRRISVGGSSAGACIALVMGVVFGDRIDAVACIAPPTDFRPEARPKIAPEPNHPRALPRRVTLFFDACYLVPDVDRSLPTLSPACAALQRGQLACPTVYVATGTGDTLHPDGQRLVDNLRRQGHQRAFFRSVKGEGHGFEKAFTAGAQRDKAFSVFDDLASVILQTFDGKTLL